MVVPYCHARRVLLQAGRATGVEVDRFGRRELYTATREVILSAGKRNLAI
jgi:choline dehydrogenase